jgi:arylsulfatase A-like enzyme
MSRSRARRRATVSVTILAATVAPCAFAQAPGNDGATTSPSAAASRWKYFPRRPTPPAGAPNVLLIMTDDVGFGATSTFGGPVPTPTFDALARAGLRYNAFHTTAMCSPTRAALLTGRNHHAVASGSLTNLAIDEEGYTAVIPKSAATIGQVLHESGYDTAWFGKNHNTPEWETGPAGPYDHWPNALGFDYFYGFNAALTDQFSPQLVENRNPIDPPTHDPAYHLDRDLSDHLIHWLQIQRNLHPDHPFFAYLAPGSMHSPHQAPADWIAKFRGKFDQGWDKLREQTFARQKQLGIVPKEAVLTPRPKELPAWASLSAGQQHTYARMMEVAAAQLAHSDYQIGRIVEELRRSGQLDNTLVFYLQGDNGASLESQLGTHNDLAALMGIEPTDASLARDIESHGGPDSFGNYPIGWAWATNTPFQWGKQVASHLGGLRDGLVISWPKRITQTGQIRSQFHHVIDIAPTIYEAAGITPPQAIDGHAQQPLDGVSMAYTFEHPDAPSTHREQYFELHANRAYYKDGWWAGTTPEVMPWVHTDTKVQPNKFQWQLYDLTKDYSQSRNVAARYPEKLAELHNGFDAAARKYHVYPLKSDIFTRLAPGLKPDILEGRSHFTYYPGETRYPSSAFPFVRPQWSMTAHVELMNAQARGPLMIQGDQFGGMGLLLEAGRPVFLYNPTGRAEERVLLQAPAPLTPGPHAVQVRFGSKAGAPRAATLVLSIDGQAVGSSDVPTLYRPRGDAYIGRQGLGGLLPDRPVGELTSARVQSVDVVIDNNR